MTIEFNCPDCNKLLRTSDERGGQTANCPACGSVVSVPRVELYNVDIPSDDIYDDDDDVYDDAGDDHAIPSTTGKEDFDSVFSSDATGSTRSQQKHQEFDEFAELDDDVFRGEKTCPMCGNANSLTAKQCSHCGENLFYQQSYQQPYQQSTQEFGEQASHRGGLILGLGIASFFTCCLFLGIASWIMGGEDIREIDAGRMDPTGRDLTQAGRVLGIVSVVLQAGIVLFFCCFIGIAEM